MKSIITLAVIAFSSVAASGQAKYYKTSKGNILTHDEYARTRDMSLERVRKVSADVKLDENLKEIRKTNDSIIYSYAWHFNLGNDDGAKAEKDMLESLIGKPFPLGELKTLDGKPIKLEDLKGKPTLINFWFATCKPCVEEMPVLNVLKKNMGQAANFVSITFETEKTANSFFKKHRFDFTPVAGARALTDALKMESYPTNIFLDKEGNVSRIEHGIPYISEAGKPMKIGNEKQFQKILEDLL